ncbi:hypothetical protein FO519_005159 [Halicephalobus sp. NKZ332]|nr:hypothetical protein FO519_005159 [Halicephalobus sp. NKZ332]
MIQLSPELLRTICLDFLEADYQKLLQKFVLSGKQCYKTYIEIFKTVDEVEFDSYGIAGFPLCYTPPDWVTATLENEKSYDIGMYITDENDEWKHALMLLGYYGKRITLPYTVVRPFYDGIAENLVATEIENCNLPDDIKALQRLQNCRTAKGIPLLKGIGVGDEFFQELAKMPKCLLKVEKCTIYETTPFSQYLRAKNFIAEELSLNSFDMKNFVDTRYRYAIDRLSPRLKKVKKITIDSHCHNHARSCPVLALPRVLEVFKKMFPALEDFEIEMLDNLKKNDRLSIRMKRIEKALQCKSFLRLKVCARFNYSPYGKTTDIEDLRKKFPDYEVSQEEADSIFPSFVLQKEVNSKRKISLRVEFPYWKTDFRHNSVDEFENSSGYYGLESPEDEDTE